MSRIKKCLGLVLCLMLMTVTMGALWAPASAMETINLLPSDLSAYTAGESDGQELAGDFTLEDGVLTIHSTGADGYRVHIVIDQTVSLETAVSLFAKVSSTVDFNVALVIEDVNGKEAWMGLASDFYNRFSLRSTGVAIEAGDYERELDFSDACTYNVHIPTDACVVKEVQIAVKAPDGTFVLSQFELADSVSPSPVIGEEEDDTTEPTEDDTDVPTTAAVTTTKAATTASGSNTVLWVVVAVVAVVTVVIVAVVIAVTKKKKAP